MTVEKMSSSAFLKVNEDCAEVTSEGKPCQTRGVARGVNGKIFLPERCGGDGEGYGEGACGLPPPQWDPGREPRPPVVLGILDIKSVGLREAKSSFFHDQAAVFRWVTNDKGRLMADNSHQGPARVTDFDRPADSSY